MLAPYLNRALTIISTNSKLNTPHSNLCTDLRTILRKVLICAIHTFNYMRSLTRQNKYTLQNKQTIRSSGPFVKPLMAVDKAVKEHSEVGIL